MKKRIIAIVLVILMISMLAFAGCNKDNTATTTEPKETTKTETKTETEKEDDKPAEEVKALEPYEIIILTAGDMPKDQQLVYDKISELTKDTMNITIDMQYTPWGDYVVTHPSKLAAAGEKFDIYLNFSFDILPAYNRKQAIKLDDLLEEYGQDIKAAISDIDWGAAVANGETIAIPAIYPKDSVYSTAIVRKDLREKYGLAPITDLESCATFLETIAANEPNIIPSVGGGMAFIAERNVKLEYPEVTHVGYLGAGEVKIGFWSEEGPDAFKVIDYYNSKQARTLVDIGVRGYNNSWFSKDLDKGLEGKPTFIGGKAALLNIDFYHFTQIEDDMKQTVPEAELEWVIMNPNQPVEVSMSNNFAQISSTSDDPARAMMLLNWIQASQDNYDLFMYGLEGTHYTLDGDTIVLPEGIDASNNPYVPTPWWFKNTLYDRNLSSDSQLTIDCVDFFKGAERYPTDDMSRGFAFVIDEVALEIAQVEKIYAEQWGAIHTGQIQDEAYDDFLATLDDAGMPKILEEMQKQLDAFLAAKG